MKRLKTKHKNSRPVIDFLTLADRTTLLHTLRAIVSEMERNDTDGFTSADKVASYESIRDTIVDAATQEQIDRVGE